MCICFVFKKWSAGELQRQLEAGVPGANVVLDTTMPTSCEISHIGCSKLGKTSGRDEVSWIDADVSYDDLLSATKVYFLTVAIQARLSSCAA